MIDIREFTPLPENEPEPEQSPRVSEAAEDNGASAVEQLCQELERARKREARLEKDFRNFRYHAERKLAEAESSARHELLGELAEVVRLLEVAIDAAERDPDSVRKGIELVAGNLQKVYREYGLERIPTIGARFDPALHEAVLTEKKADIPRGTVTGEVCPGFRTDEGVVRAAKVAVAA